MQSASAYIGNRAMPTITVSKESDKYYVFDQPDWFRNEADVRAELSTGPESGYDLSTDSYQTIPYSMATYVSDEARANQDPGLELDRTAVEFATDKILMMREKLASTLLFATGSYNSSAAAGTVWTDAAADIFADVNTAKETIAGAIGREPDTLIINDQTLNALKAHPDIQERIKYTQTGIATEDLLASLFELRQVLVGRAIENTSGKGDAAVYSRIWGGSAAFLYSPAAAGTRSLCFAKWFNLASQNFLTERWRVANGGAGDGFRVRAAFDEKVVSNLAGYLLTGVTT
jgi:hypothetical protein